MHSKKFILLPLLLLSCIILNAQGVDERAKNKAENKANNRVDNKVDQGLDKGFDAIEGLFKKKKKKKKDSSTTDTDNEEKGESESIRTREDTKKGEPIDMSGMFGGMFEAAEWEDSYVFTLVSEATVTSTDKKGRSETNYMNMYSSDKAFGMRMDENEKGASEGFVVFDFENQSFITLTENDGKKEGMAMAMNQDQKSLLMQDEITESMEEEYGDIKFRKTGRSKKIAGHLAWEYEATGEGGEGTMWVSEDVKFNAETFFGLFNNSSKKNNFMPDNYPDGYLLEMDYTDSESGERSHYLVTRLDDNAKETIDLGPYNVMDMKTMMQQGGQR